jgi:hypothetical protein
MGHVRLPSLSHHYPQQKINETQRPHPNGDSTSSHDHPHVDNRCVPSFRPLLLHPLKRAAGFDKLMPEGRHAPWKYFPRPGAHLSVTFGTPVPPEVVRGALGTVTRDEVVPGAAEEQQRKDREVRIALTDVVQRAVEALGRQVSGDLLVGPGPGQHPPLPPPRKRI